jgi:hypothetical protein
MMKSLGECIEGDVHLDMLVTQGHHRCDDDDNMAAFERLTLRPSGVFRSSTQSEESVVLFGKALRRHAVHLSRLQDEPAWFDFLR